MNRESIDRCFLYVAPLSSLVAGAFSLQSPIRTFLPDCPSFLSPDDAVPPPLSINDEFFFFSPSKA